MLEGFEMSTETVSIINRYDPCFSFMHADDELFDGFGQIFETRLGGFGGYLLGTKFFLAPTTPKITKRSPFWLTARDRLSVWSWQMCGKQLHVLGLGIIPTSPLAVYFEDLSHDLTTTVHRLELIWLTARHSRVQKAHLHVMAGFVIRRTYCAVSNKLFHWTGDGPSSGSEFNGTGAAADIAKLESKGNDTTSLPARVRFWSRRKPGDAV
jgi:hypothetical protein